MMIAVMTFPLCIAILFALQTIVMPRKLRLWEILLIGTAVTILAGTAV